MARARDWLEGARLRTLTASISPVIAGTGLAWFLPGPPDRFSALMIVAPILCLIVALGFQIGSNFANDYSDGIRGTDDRRLGPPRLVGSGAAAPRTVKRAALACFGVGCLAGLVAVYLVQAWWLILVGLACGLAAWFYTGGKRPYGYAGFGEVFVFIFFGLVATIGTTYVVTRSRLSPCPVGGFCSHLNLPWLGAILAGVIFGSLATLVAALLSRRMKHPWLAPLPPVVINALVIGAMLSYMLELPFWLTAVEVGLGQTGACYVLGMPLLLLLKRMKEVK